MCISINTIVSESDDKNINTIQKLLHNHYKIAIIGIAKNAGKTTVLNTIIETYKDKPLCITSVGLDGEKIDNITRQDKPRVRLYPGMYVLTAEACLTESTIDYRILEKTNIRSALGTIVLVEVIQEGLVLVAGPSSKLQLQKAFQYVEKYKPFKILIDGALFRKSIASTEVADGVIYVTGASYSSDIMTVVNDTKSNIDQLQLLGTKLPVKMIEKCNENIIYYNENTEEIKVLEGRFINEEEKIVQIINEKATHIYTPGAITDRMIDVLVQNHSKVTNLHIVVQNSSFLLFSQENYRKIQKLHVNICVLNPIEILFVAYNPTSPFSYDFKNTEFKALLREATGFNVINVLEDCGVK